jgi:hypothetical protein
MCSGDANTLRDAQSQSEGYCELQMWERAWDALEDLPDHRGNTAEALQARVAVLLGSGEVEKALILAQSLSGPCGRLVQTGVCSRGGGRSGGSKGGGGSVHRS